MNIAIVICYLASTLLGLTFFKLGADNPLVLKFSNPIEFKIGIYTLIGFLFYIVSFLLWQKVVTSYNMSYIIPITFTIVQIISVIIGVLIFKESITLMQVIGIIFMIAGILLVSLGGK